MTAELKELPRCNVCNVPLGESNNTLCVEGRWVHYTCAFYQVVEKIRNPQTKVDNNAI